MKNITINQFMFALGVYPKINATEKYSLLGEIVAQTHMFSEFNQTFQMKKMKKLSPEKKASFMVFIETLNIEEMEEEYKAHQIKWVNILSADYPSQLKEIYIPPIVLFYKGNFELLQKKNWLGVVGSRDYTSYGKQALLTIIPKIISSSNKEIGIVSGLAKGIDTEAHMATIKNDGHTIGVVGSGLDQYYPLKNRKLQEYMSEHHLVVSEYPIGSKPLKFHFPERNRIIAGISRGILVIESEQSSGSLITAYNAIDEGRDVFAVPGSIFEKNREGNHRLIQSGALLTSQPTDILKEWFYI